MKDAQKPDHISLTTLIGRLKEGRYVVPDFQREFEWKPWDIRDLMRSIFLDYYIGSLLLWRGKKENFESMSCEPLYGFDGEGKPEYIVLDGQQRLTALYYAFISPDVPLPNRSNKAHYFVHVDKFMNEEFDQAFNYDWLNKRWVPLLADKERQYREHIFPMATIGEGGWALPNWVQGYEQFWQRQEQTALEAGDVIRSEEAAQYKSNAKDFGVYLKDLTEQYQIAYIELDKELAVDKVCDIFTQINSKGIQLDVFDLINALLKPKGLQLKAMWREAAKRLEFVDTDKMNVYILQVMSILRQGYCSPKYLYFLLPGQAKPIREPDGSRRQEILVPSIEDFKARWDRASHAIEQAIKLLSHPQEFGAVSSSYLPYVSIIPAFSSLYSEVNALPANARLDAQRKLRHWYWASVFTNRYSGSVESTTARDYLDVKAWFNDDLVQPALIQEFESRFRSLDLRKEVRRGTSVYNGIFNLLVLQGARDWMTGTIPQHGDLDDHHIVPASWGAKLDGKAIHTILNRTPLTADTNRHAIRDRLPNEYLPELIAASSAGQVRTILESHFISPKAQEILMRDPFTPEDYQEFLGERQRTLQEAIETLLVKERLDLSPQLRELDQHIEAVELGIRELIETVMEQDTNRIPDHIAVKVDERIQLAAKKNAALDADFFQTLAGKLEFFDLRELQNTIESKSLWPKFEPVFASKGTLQAKFGQLAELRNAIRHSRTVDDVTRKEGEAAILWFNHIISKQS